MTISTMRGGERMRATYAFQPVDHLYRGEFYLGDERWRAGRRKGCRRTGGNKTCSTTTRRGYGAPG